VATGCSLVFVTRLPQGHGLGDPDVAHRGIKTTDEGSGWCAKASSMGAIDWEASKFVTITPSPPSAFNDCHGWSGDLRVKP